MVNLFKYIKESILDDEDIIFDKTDKEIVKRWLNDPNSEFRKDLNDLNIKGIEHDIIDDYLYLGSPKLGDYKIDIDKCKLINYPELKQLNINKLYKHRINLQGSSINPSNIYKDIYTECAIIESKEIKDINIHIISSDFLGKDSRYFGWVGAKFGAPGHACEIIDNVEIDFDKRSLFKFSDHDNIRFNDYPKRINLKTNANNISFYNPFLFKPKSELMNILDKLILKDYEFKYWDSFKLSSSIIIIENFKKLYSILNNIKKYGKGVDGSDMFTAKNKATLRTMPLNTDFDIKKEFPWVNKMNDLHTITMRDNNIVVKFLKTPKFKFFEGFPIKHGWYVYVYNNRG